VNAVESNASELKGVGVESPGITPVPNDERDLIRRWVDTWRAAGPELESIRRREAESVDIQEAVRQLFQGMESVLTAPAPATSGLIEQQRWFSRIRAGSRKAPKPVLGK
jgi:hypothetical protein